MRSRFFIIPAALMVQIAGAQNSPLAITSPQATLTEVSVSPLNPFTPVSLTDPGGGGGEKIIDYKSVYEAATLEEELQMATERYRLSQSQHDVWEEAAFDRRLVEKQAYEKLNSKTTDNNSKEAAYKGLRTAHNTFYEIITGYLSPAQKSAMEFDREIINEKNRRLAKIPPPPPPAPTITVAPVDSTLIKAAEKPKVVDKKSKKKKKQPVGK